MAARAPGTMEVGLWGHDAEYQMNLILIRFFIKCQLENQGVP